MVVNTEQDLHMVHIVDLRVIGGIERMAVALIAATPNVRHTLVLFDKTTHPSLAKTLHALPQVQAIHSSKHWAGLRLPKSQRHKRRVHLIAQSGANVVLNWSQVLDMRGIALPIVFYEHGSAWENYTPEQLAHCYAPVHHCIAVSNAAKRMLQLHHHVQQPIHIVENTVFTKPSVATQARTLPTGRLVLGAAGRLVARKNFAVLIHAVALLRAQQLDVVLHIAGTGPEQGVLQALVGQLGLQQQVQLLGYVQDMPAFYQQTDVFVCPSIWESYGLVAIEAFAAGLPVVGAATDGLPEVVGDGVNGVCVLPSLDATSFEQCMHMPASFAHDSAYQPQTDALTDQKSVKPEALAQAIAGLLLHPETYQQMSQAALNTALTIKSFQQLADAVVLSVKEAVHAN